MPIWKSPYGPDRTDIKVQLNACIAGFEADGHCKLPVLDPGSPLVIASDYAGQKGNYEILAYVVTTRDEVMGEWEATRTAMRSRYLPERRKMEFKGFNDVHRIRALPAFLDLADSLNGFQVCVAVERSIRFHDDPSATKTQEKLFRISAFGGMLIDGFRSPEQDVFWLTDNDDIVANDKMTEVAITTMAQMSFRYDNERQPNYGIGVSGKFDDDLRAEDLLAITDLAGGAFCEHLTLFGNHRIEDTNMSKQASEPPSPKTVFINNWRANTDKRLKHLTIIVQNEGPGNVRVSFGNPSISVLDPTTRNATAIPLSDKWVRAIQDYHDSVATTPEP